MKNTVERKSTLELVLHEVGLLEMKDGRTTPEDRVWAQELAQTMHTRIAKHRRAKLPTTVAIKKAAPISARLLAMTRATLEDLLASLVECVGPNAQVAHRQLDTLSDKDLRNLIQTLETQTKQG
jgi:hypothetical protein